MSSKRATANIKKGIALLDIGFIQMKKQVSIGERAKMVKWLREDMRAKRVDFDLHHILEYAKGGKK